MVRWAGIGAVVAAVLMLGACSSSGDGQLLGGRLSIDLFVDSNSLSVGQILRVTVVADNAGTASVSWGTGSSMCQLRAVVPEGAELLTARAEGPCTDDLAPWTLEPGETRVEEWDWDGTVLRAGGEWEPLSPGTYQLVGSAGALTGTSVTITILD